LWHDGSNSPSFTVTGAGLVHVTLQSDCWQISDTLEIIEDASGPMIDLGSDTTVCEGETILIEAGTPGVDYLWHDGSTGSSFLATTTQQIILQISNACGIDTDTIFVTVDGSGPDVELGEDTILCEGTSLVLIPEISGAATLQWQDGSDNASFTVNGPGLYSLQASNICGVASDSILITAGFIPQDFSLGDDRVICEGETVTLNAPLTSDALLWQDGSANTSFIANEPGLYNLQIVNACGITADTIKISLMPAPQDFSLGADHVICPGETITLTAPTTSDALQWSDGSTSETLITSSGVIWLNITNSCGTAQDSISIAINQDILATDIDPLYQICDGESVALDVTQTFDAQYLWSTGAITPDLQLTESGIYIVTITSECDVTETSTEIVTEDCDPLNVFVPNIFSPNGDNINDLLLVLTNFPERIADFQFTVFDRWGNVIFFSKEINTGWDGSFRESPVNPGVYIYTVRWRDMDGTPIVVIEHGDITLIR
jgi:gliding motility-associated-like protein